jgi:hypothetical protein
VSSGAGGARTVADAGTGGAKNTGGSPGTGGAKNTGGSPGTGGANNVGGSPGTGGTANTGGSTGTSIQCADPVKTLPAGAPALQAGTWVDIRPQGITWGENGHAVGLAISRCNPAVLYVGIGSFNSSTGVFRTTDAGATWNQIAKDVLNGGAFARVDPGDPKNLYFVSGVRGATGFWTSSDAGDTLVMPQSFKDIQTTAGFYGYDVYDIDTDPTDFKHFLLSFHGAWGWTDTKWDTNSGVLESKDGGATWIVHEPLAGWGTGHAVHFLYNPELGLGSASTWLLGTQGAGMWRTTDAGATWNKVTDVGIQHGGGKIYYTKAGVLYATSGDKNIRSTDNGATWTAVGPGGGYNAIIGDGTTLYTAKCFGPTPFMTSAETDGTTWTALNAQQFDQGPFEMQFDPTNGIVYGSLWGAGVWALKVK